MAFVDAVNEGAIYNRGGLPCGGPITALTNNHAVPNLFPETEKGRNSGSIHVLLGTSSVHFARLNFG